MEDGRGTEYPQYEHYQLGRGSAEEPDFPERRKRKKQESFGKKLGTTVVLAAVFGLVSGGVFLGIMKLTGAFSHMENRTEIGTVERVESESSEEAALEDTGSINEDSAVSGKGIVAEVAEASMPAVVAITTVSIQEIPSFFGYGVRRYQSAGSGSGIIVGENENELLIATNNHVVQGASTLSVCFIGNDVVNAEEETANLLSADGDINVEDAVSAKIKGTDAENDLAVVAVLKADIPQDTMEQIKIAQIGSSENLVVGEQVVAIGNALGYGQSVTSGWISALDRSLSMEDGISKGLIQTDAAINPGNSGGALLNLNGELIGINSAKYADNAVEGMGYAIPISKALPILEELMNRKTREKVDGRKAAFLGIDLLNRPDELLKMYNMPQGAFVSVVYEGGAAANAGMINGDIIVEMDGQKISDVADLTDKLQYYSAGEEIEVTVSRSYDGEYRENVLDVTLGSRPVG